MKSPIWIVGLALVLAGCEKSVKSLTPPPPTPPAAQTAPTTDRMVSRELQLYQYDRKSTSTKPRFEIKTDKATMSQDDVWEIEGAKATVHTAKDEDIHIAAAKGNVDQRKDKESAFLQGGVVMDTPTSKFEMQSAQWSNQDGKITSDDPVSIDSKDIQMTASSLVYYPDDDRLLLTNVSGAINLRGPIKP